MNWSPVYFAVVLALWRVARPACVVNPDIVDPDPDCPDNEQLTNAELGSGKFQGDIDLTEQQKVAVGNYEGDIDLAKEQKNTSNGLLRNALIDPSRLWPKSGAKVYIPYDSSGVGNLARLAFRNARRTFEKHTCIRFRYRTSESNYIELVSERGCFSDLGMIGGGQKLSLGISCAMRGIAIHELMHAIGFLHEQSRPDRDQFVNIILQNVQQGYEDQFRKGNPSLVYNILTYDYSSILHYPGRAFSRNGQPTIVPKQSGVYIGQRQGLSKKDIRKINELYSCDRSTSESGSSSTSKATRLGTGDKNPNCCAWALRGECSANPRYMRVNCSQACGTPGATVATALSIKDNIPPACAPKGIPNGTKATDGNPSCAQWKDSGECKKNPFYMNAVCRKSCKTTVEAHLICGDTDRPPIPGCVNKEKKCASWAYSGECTKNAPYMTRGCCLACRRLNDVILKNCPKG